MYFGLHRDNKEGGTMRKLAGTVALTLFLALFQIQTADAVSERVVIRALERVRACIEGGCNYATAASCLTNAKVELEKLKHAKKSKLFCNKAQGSYDAYERGLKIWKKSMKEDSDPPTSAAQNSFNKGARKLEALYHMVAR